MYIVNYDKNLNGLYVQLTDDMTDDDVLKASQEIKDIVRKNLKPNFISVINLTGVSVETLKKHINSLKQTQVVVAIRRVNKIIRIGSKDVLHGFSKSFDEFYIQGRAPTILHFSSVEECFDLTKDLDMWFGSLLIGD